MEPAEILELKRRARHAYERGRLQRALWRAPRLLPVVVAMFVSCRYPGLAGLSASLLLLVVIGLSWRGEVYGRAVASGIGAGLVPLAATVAAGALSYAGAAWACWQVCVGLCAGAGLLAGLVLAHGAAQHGPGRRTFLVSAVSVAALVGAPGCAFAGAMGVGGMLLALALVSMPAALRTDPVRP